MAAVGIRVARGVTMHGFALNCDCALDWQERVVACGIADAGVTSLSQITGERSVCSMRPMRWSAICGPRNSTTAAPRTRHRDRSVSGRPGPRRVPAGRLDSPERTGCRCGVLAPHGGVPSRPGGRQRHGPAAAAGRWPGGRDYALAAPGTWGDLLAVQLQAVAAPSPGSLPVDLGLVILAPWTVSTGMHALLRAIRSVSGLPREGFFLVRTLAVAVGMLVIAAVAVAAEVIDATTLTRSIIGVVVLVAVLIGLVALVYFASVGASRRVAGTASGSGGRRGGLLIVGLLLNVYAAVSPNLALVYGTIAGVIVSMLTVWLSVCAVLVGAALNAEIPPRGVRT